MSVQFLCLAGIIKRMSKNTKQVGPTQFGILPQHKSLYGRIVWVRGKHWWDKDDSKSEEEKAQQEPCEGAGSQIACHKHTKVR